MLAMLFLAGLAAWNGFALAVFLAGALLALILFARGWSRLALVRLAYSRRLAVVRAFPGDRVECTVRLDNRKLLPLVWVNVADRVPAAIAPEADALPPGITLAAGHLSVDTSLLWYQQATWRYPLECRRRGYYRLGPTRLTSADIFGIFARSRRAASSDHLIVYPRIYPVADLGLPSASPLGELRSRNPMFQDPTRVCGLRDYTKEVPFRHIHWKASARAGNLQAKVFEPTCSLQASILVDASAFVTDAGIREEGFELAMSTAASLAWHFVHGRCQVGLFVNTRLADGGAFGAIKPASGVAHLAEILEVLAKARPHIQPFPKFLETVRPHLGAGSTLAVVTGALQPEVEGRLADLKARGLPVSAFVVGDGPAGGRHFPCRRIVRPADLAQTA